MLLYNGSVFLHQGGFASPPKATGWVTRVGAKTLLNFLKHP